MKKLLALCLAAGAALASCTEPAPSIQPSTTERSIERSIEIPVKACRFDSVEVPNSPPLTPAELMRRVPAEAKRGLKDGVAVLPRRPPPAAAAALVAEQQRYLDETERLAAQFGNDEHGYEQARAALKRQTIRQMIR